MKGRNQLIFCKIKISILRRCQHIQEYVIETNMRLKTYRTEAAKHDCVDIINKLNEVEANCPTFVVANLNHNPITTADSFDLSKICRNIEMVRQLENSVTNNFATLSCLQSDFSIVLKNVQKLICSLMRWLH